MKCPSCMRPDSRVLDTRLSRDALAVRRRRHCETCDYRFTTFERVEHVWPVVVKKDGTRAAYDRLKLLNGFKKACEKRPVSMDSIESCIDELEKRFMGLGEKEISSRQIGEAVMEALKNIDDVAYVRFASVYREFRDLEQFMDELQDYRKDRVLSRKKKKKKELKQNG